MQQHISMHGTAGVMRHAIALLSASKHIWLSWYCSPFDKRPLERLGRQAFCQIQQEVGIGEYSRVMRVLPSTQT